MATKTPKTAIVIDTDEKPAVKGLKNLVKEYGKASTQINQGLEIVSKGWDLVSGAIGGTISALSEYVELAAEQERVELRIRASIRRRVAFTDQEFDALQALNAERQRALGVGDEAQLQMQGTLVAMGVSKDQINAATEATLGLADATGQGLNEASKTVAKTFGGNIGVLKEYGITVGSVSEAKRELAGLFEVAGAQSDTLSTKIKVLDAALGDTKEVLGATVNGSEDLKEIFDALTDSVEDLGKILSGAEGVQLINETARALSGLAAGAINAALGARALVRDIGDLGGGRVEAAFDLTNVFSSVDRGDSLRALVFGAEDETEIVSEYEKMLQSLADKLTAVSTRAPFVGPLPAPETGATGRSAGQGETAAQRKLREEAKKKRQADFFASVSAGGFSPEDQIAADEREAVLTRAEAMADLRDMLRVQELDADFEFRQKQIAAMEQHAQDLQAPARFISATMQSSIANGIVGMTNALLEGENVMASLQGFFGDVVISLGNTLIQMGATALAMAPFGAIPAFWPAVGGPGVSAAVGAGALVAGAGIVAIGSAMGGRGSAGRAGGGGGAASPNIPPIPSGDILPGGFRGGPGFAPSGPRSSVVNVNFNTPIDSRRARRELQDLMAVG